MYVHWACTRQVASRLEFASLNLDGGGGGGDGDGGGGGGAAVVALMVVTVTLVAVVRVTTRVFEVRHVPFSGQRLPRYNLVTS